MRSNKTSRRCLQPRTAINTSRVNIKICQAVGSLCRRETPYAPRFQRDHEIQIHLALTRKLITVLMALVHDAMRTLLDGLNASFAKGLRNALLAAVAALGIGLELSSQAQVYGPRQWWLTPKGITVPLLTGIYTEGDITLDDGIVYPDFNISTYVLFPSIVRFTSLAGQSAQVSIGAPFVWADAELDTGNRKFTQNASGPGDLYLHLATGIINAPALDGEEYVKYMLEQNPTVVMYGLTALTAPTGKYDSEKVINIGTNRWSFKLGLPTTIRLSRNWLPGKTTTLEILPTVDFFTPNNNPSLSNTVVPLDVPVQVPVETVDESGNPTVVFEETTVQTAIRLGDTDLVPERVWQKPIYSIEAHLTHDINERLWVSLDSYSRFGGETVNDSKDQGNQQSWTSLGATIGVVPWDNSRLTFSGGKIIGRNRNSPEAYQFMLQYQHHF